MSTKQKKKESNSNSGSEKIYLLMLFVCCFAIGAVLYFWRGQWYWCLFPFLFFVVMVFFILNSKSSRKAKENEEDEEQFVTLFTYFSIYIQDGFNVYNAFEEILPYAKGRVKNHLEGLLMQITRDKTLLPYLSFAGNFKSLEIREVMMAIYQMVDQGSGGVYLTQFQRLFAKLSDQKRLRRERKHLEKLDSLSFLPLVGSGFSMLMLMLAITEIMGGMLSGL